MHPEFDIKINLKLYVQITKWKNFEDTNNSKHKRQKQYIKYENEEILQKYNL